MFCRHVCLVLSWAFGDVCSILAAVAHDVGHPGKTNAFLQNSYHPLSIIYNDASILENFHTSLLFRIMSEVYVFFFSQRARVCYAMLQVHDVEGGQRISPSLGVSGGPLREILTSC